MNSKQKIFNIGQANLFIMNGATVCGVGWSLSKMYIEFIVNEDFKNVMKRWQNKEFINK